jgi:hypothetical protein
MSGQAYQGSAKRTFEQAIKHLLETEYNLVGSGRILQLLAEDIKALAETFFPPATRLSPGWMVFVGTKAQVLLDDNDTDAVVDQSINEVDDLPRAAS